MVHDVKSKSYVQISKRIAYVLRHNPASLPIEMDNHGWVDVKELILGLGITFDDLEFIVNFDEKKRYSFNSDKTAIRANQGHSIPVDVEMAERQPPETLYHGTASRFLDSIMKTGLEKRNRQYVHLTSNYETALKTGERHGKSIVLGVRAGQMYRDGFKFYLTENNVWQVDNVLTKYLMLM